jgi:hypothetical protein
MIAIEQEKAIYEANKGYRNDPKGFITKCLDVKPEHYWPKMEEIANSVRDNQLTAVPACHSVSKTFGAGRIATWFKSCYFPSTVVTTAPSDNLVRNQLWREIHAAYSGASVPLGGKMTALMWDVKPSKEVLSGLKPTQRALWEKNFAIGFSTSPDTVTEHATKMQGFHNKYVLIILDEAGGLLRPIWKAVLEGLVIDERVRVLAIGNPTDPVGYFAQVCKPDSGWNVINVSVTDTPNYKENREVVPGIAGKAYYNRMAKDYGINSNTFKIRVLGQFPSYREGTFYGQEIAEARRGGLDSRIGVYPYEPGLQVYTASDLGDMYTAFIFFQLRQGRIRIIDCYWNNQGVGLPEYAKMLHSKPYDYLEHYTGGDLIGSNAKSVQTGLFTRDIAAQLGINFTPILLGESFEDGIQAVRSIWPILEINKSLCKVFIQAVDGYRKKKNEALSTDDQPSYHQTPIPNAWENHMMDALRHLALAYRYMIGKGRQIKQDQRTTTRKQDDACCDWDPNEW